MAKERSKRKNRVSDEAVIETIIQLCAAAGLEDAVKPEEVALELAPENWQSLLKRVRLFARQLAQAGHVVILRKGQPVDPDDFKGVIRLRIAESFFEAPPG